jgi:hypothetical protein
MFSRWPHKFNTAATAFVSADHVDKEGTIVLMGVLPFARRMVSSKKAEILAGGFGTRVTKESH